MIHRAISASVVTLFVPRGSRSNRQPRKNHSKTCKAVGASLAYLSLRLLKYTVGPRSNACVPTLLARLLSGKDALRALFLFFALSALQSYWASLSPAVRMILPLLAACPALILIGHAWEANNASAGSKPDSEGGNSSSDLCASSAAGSSDCASAHSAGSQRHRGSRNRPMIPHARRRGDANRAGHARADKDARGRFVDMNPHRDPLRQPHPTYALLGRLSGSNQKVEERDHHLL